MTLLVVVVLALGVFLGLRQSRVRTTAISQPLDRPAGHPKLPAPSIPQYHQTESDPAPPPSRIRKMLTGEELPEIRPEQLEEYLASNHRNAASLIAAFRLTGDRRFFDEAVEKAPNDPRVACASWFRTQDKVERQKWLEKWEKADPRNALASYLAAANLFKSGMNDAALGQLEAVGDKTEFSYFARESILDCEEAYEAAGYSETEAKMAATMGLLLPHLVELKGLSQNLADLALAYRDAGDEASAQAALNIGFQMTRRIAAGPSCLIEDLVALAAENNLLKGMDPNSPTGTPGKTVQDLQNETKERREALKTAGKASEAILQTLGEADLGGYCDRVQLFGERAAMDWLKEKFGSPQDSSAPTDGLKARLH